MGPDDYQAAFARGASLTYEVVAPIILAAIDDLLADLRHHYTRRSPVNPNVRERDLEVTADNYDLGDRFTVYLNWRPSRNDAVGCARIDTHPQNAWAGC